MNPSDRIYFLDNLRAFVIMLVVVLHGSLTYMAFAPEWWYVLDPQRSLLFTAIVILVDVPIMLIIFFVAGYFALPSLQKRGSATFLKDKFQRVGLPWIFGALILAPPTAYIIYYSRDFPVSFLDFWSGDFWGPVYQQSVYWFLGVLFLFFILLSGAFRLSASLRTMEQQQQAPSAAFLAGFWAIITASFLTINQFYPVDTWQPIWYLFMVQPLRVPLYIGYFLLGIYAYRNGWFTEGGYTPNLLRWGGLFLLSGLLYLGYRLAIPSTTHTTLLLQAGNAILFNSFCLSSLLAGVAFFKRFVNGAGPFWRSQAANSYGIYYVHPLILYPLAMLFVPLTLNVYLKATLLILLALALSWAVSAFILKKAPLVRHAF